MQTLEFTLNGKAVNIEIEENELLLETLRNRLSITSVKEGCSIGECGTCTVLIDDEPATPVLRLPQR